MSIRRRSEIRQHTGSRTSRPGRVSAWRDPPVIPAGMPRETMMRLGDLGDLFPPDVLERRPGNGLSGSAGGKPG